MEPEKTPRLCGGCQLPGGEAAVVTQGVTTWEAASLDSSSHVLGIYYYLKLKF